MLTALCDVWYYTPGVSNFIYCIFTDNRKQRELEEKKEGEEDGLNLLGTGGYGEIQVS